ncbi:MAG: peptidyl-alpha-hydroxyglycine alpha-amidating lyase family protein [archaeon]
MTYGVEKYQYELVEDWAKLPKGWSFRDVGGITIDKEDRVYVLNRSEHPIIVLDRDGNLVHSWGEGFFSRPHGSCMGPDNSIYCTDDITHIVAKFTQGGKLLMTLGNKGEATDTGYVQTFDSWESLARIVRGAPPFNRPAGVSISPKGEIYVADGYGNARIHKFSADGRMLLSWGEPGGKPGQFRLPHSVRVDDRGHVWVVDRENHRIQIFDANGEFLSQWTDFVRPTDLFIDKDNTVYVSELSKRVGIFTIDGKLLARWGNPGTKKEDALFLSPHAIAVDSHGDIYVGEVSMTDMQVDRGPRTIQKFSRKRQ